MVSRTPVGVIGVGLMGEVYARSLVAAGFTVIGYDVDPAKNGLDELPRPELAGADKLRQLGCGPERKLGHEREAYSAVPGG